MDASAKLAGCLKGVSLTKVVDFDAATDSLFTLDLTLENTSLNSEIVADTTTFSHWVNQQLAQHNCRYGIGGYLELRTIYDSRPHFSAETEPRRLHLGVDIWADAGTAVYAPLDGEIHSFKDNNNYGDYGPTIVLKHLLNGLTFYSLYGHLSRKSLVGLSVGQAINAGQQIANFGDTHENGNWPPHLHLQLMLDMEGNYGDYPGACRNSEKEKYLKNIPDPALIFNWD